MRKPLDSNLIQIPKKATHLAMFATKAQRKEAMSRLERTANCSFFPTQKLQLALHCC